jgi:hypothetical protein
MAIIIDIADAVVAELNGHSFSVTLAAVRAYLPQFDLAEMDALHVTVVPKSLASEIAGRNLLQTDYTIDLAVQEKPADLANATLDGLMGLVQEIADYFALRVLASPAACCIKIENSPIYSIEHLGTLRQFTSVLSLTFRLIG